MRETPENHFFKYDSAFDEKVNGFFEKNSITTKKTDRSGQFPSGIIDSFKPCMQKKQEFTFRAETSLTNKG
ncbi:hypothetical protein [Turicimonas muris]|uniref:Uncharacterized protein n=1 Tax=Turicimonas muris TaxID=1796652 RepID=A0A227KTH0_9BURK|nr:hypothetical protein [Turicimonas muris]ANU65342.1 hypothetical protein A4V04_02075 [Burkholderiales bacterium YL45]OXE51147.1 hypothetical protein ADH67_02315 [Turicimonas muris]QQQ96498.1 hypothetical protein I5Q81_11230 [Turicimonas muris]